MSMKFTPCENDDNDDEIPSNVIITVLSMHEILNFLL